MITRIADGGPQGHVAGVDSKGNVLVKSTRAPLSITSHDGSAVAVGTVSGVLVAATEGRKAIYLCNRGTQSAYLRYGSSSATVNDFRLAPGASFAFESPPEDDLNAISEGGGTSVAVIEVKV